MIASTENKEKGRHENAEHVLLIALTLLVSIGTVGVPGTATITATALFTAAGLLNHDAYNGKTISVAAEEVKKVTAA